MLVLAVLGLSAMPPFGIFRSEFLIVVGRPVRSAATRSRRCSSSSSRSPSSGCRGSPPRRCSRPLPSSVGSVRQSREGETSRWIVVAMALGLAGLVVLGSPRPGRA